MKWPAGNLNTHVSQKKRTNRSLCICYLKVIEGQVSLSTLCGTLKVPVNSSCQRTFSTNLQFGTVKVIYLEISFPEKSKIYGVDSLTGF